MYDNYSYLSTGNKTCKTSDAPRFSQFFIPPVRRNSGRSLRFFLKTGEHFLDVHILCLDSTLWDGHRGHCAAILRCRQWDFDTLLAHFSKRSNKNWYYLDKHLRRYKVAALAVNLFGRF
jgi:hypothetical protein